MATCQRRRADNGCMVLVTDYPERHYLEVTTLNRMAVALIEYGPNFADNLLTAIDIVAEYQKLQNI